MSSRRRRRTRRGLVAFVVALLLIPTAAAGGQAKANLIDLEDEVMCIVCERPLSTSAGDAADDQRSVMQGFIDEGLTKQQVKDRMVAEYGEDVLVEGRSPVAAAAPVIAAVIGVGSITLLLRRRRASATGPDDDEGRGPDPQDPEPGRTPAAQPSAADEARIDAELSER